VIGQLYSLRGSVRLARFRVRHHRPSLDRGIGYLEEAVARLRVSHPDRPLVLAALSNGLLWRYELTSDNADLDGAVDLLREAIASPAATTADRAAFGADLAGVLRSRFLRDGDVADLDEAIDAATAAIGQGEEVNAAVSNRALALLARYERTAHLPDLLAALSDARTPVRGPLQAALHRGLRLGVLIDALASRYQHTSEEADLAAAAAAGRDALATLSRVDPNRSLYAARLSEVLRLSENAALLSEAVDRAEEAVQSSSPEHVDHSYRLSSLSMAMFRRHLHTGGRDDLLRAREMADQALAAGAGRNRPMLLQRVGQLARRWFDVTGDRAALEHAERAIREALDATTADHPVRRALVCELDDLRRRHPDGREGAAEVRELLVSALRKERATSSLHYALRAATRLGELGAETGDDAAAMLGYRRAVELLPTAAWPGLRRAVREARLADAPRATDAAAQAISAHERALAVELLEAGRSVLWSQQLSLYTDLDHLYDAAPDLADRMMAVRGRLERRGTLWGE
jgi:tetratricopeptide (TPR) repeat protein